MLFVFPNHTSKLKIMGKGRSSKQSETSTTTSVNHLSQEQQETGNSTSNFVDNSPEAIEARRLQELANNSDETNNLTQLQENASEHDNSSVSQYQDTSSSPELVPSSSLRDFVNDKPEHDPGQIADAAIKATSEYHKWAAEFANYVLLNRYTEEEVLLACRLAIREMREAQVSKDVSNDGQTYVDLARKQGSVADTAMNFEGELQWRGQGGILNQTDFGKWILEGGAEPDTSTSVLNCWELVLYSAYKEGILTKERITTLYRNFGSDLSTSVQKAFSNFDVLRKGEEYTYDKDDPDSPKPIKGDMVIFKDFMNHVTIATGNTVGGKIEIMSLWTQNNKKTYKTTIEDLLAGGAASPVKFFTPNW